MTTVTALSDQPLPEGTAAFMDSYTAQPGSVAATGADDTVDLISALPRMRVSDTPFAHGVIDDFLPTGVYESIVEQWPDPTAMSPVQTKADGGYVGTRAAQLIDEWSGGNHSTSTTGVWNQVASALRDPALLHSLISRFAPVVETNLAACGDDGVVPGFRLYQCLDRGTDEALGAHVDALRKLLTIVVYIDLSAQVTAESSRRWGTTLYTAEPGAVVPVHFTPNADHEPVHTVEFAPNRAFVMPNTGRALHGVRGGQTGVERRTLMCGYWAFPVLS